MNNINTLPIGTVLNNGTYRIDEYLASGQFGNTYKVTEIRTGNIFAIKEFYLADDVVRQNDNTVTVATSAKEALFEGQKNKFVKEAERLKSIHHKNIVRVIDYFPENNTWYYVMEYIDGKSLQQWLNGTPFVSEEKAMPVFMQLLDGLNHIHSLLDPLLHLDIKPSNIMVDKHGNTYLIDFGSSKHYDEDNGVKTRSVLTATNAYAPLELVKSRYNDLGPWTDLYSLGATLFKMLSNQSPSEVEDKGKAAFGKSSHISSPIKKLILWMMEYRWGNRPQSVKEVLDYLKKNLLNNNAVEDHAIKNTPNRFDEERTIIAEAKPISKDDERTIIESSKIRPNKDQDTDRNTQKVSSYKEKLMPSSYGIISTQCSSGSARVVIDNKYCGMTPLKTSVDVGAHVVSVYSNDESRTYTVNVKKGQTVEVRSCFGNDKLGKVSVKEVPILAKTIFSFFAFVALFIGPYFSEELLFTLILESMVISYSCYALLKKKDNAIMAICLFIYGLSSIPFFFFIYYSDEFMAFWKYSHFHVEYFWKSLLWLILLLFSYFVGFYAWLSKEIRDVFMLGRRKIHIIDIFVYIIGIIWIGFNLNNAFAHSPAILKYLLCGYMLVGLVGSFVYKINERH